MFHSVRQDSRQTVGENKSVSVEVVAVAGRNSHHVFVQGDADGCHPHGRTKAVNKHERRPLWRADLPRMSTIELLAEVGNECTEDLQDPVMLVGALEFQVGYGRQAVCVGLDRLHRERTSSLIICFQGGDHCVIEVEFDAL